MEKEERKREKEKRELGFEFDGRERGEKALQVQEKKEKK